MVIVFASREIDPRLEPRYTQTKNYKYRICCFFAKDAALRGKRTDWLVRN